MFENNYTENEIYHMLFQHEITKEKALELLSAAPNSVIKGREVDTHEDSFVSLDELIEVSPEEFIKVSPENQKNGRLSEQAQAFELEDIRTKIIEIVAGNLHLPEEELENEMSFKDLGVDSINGIEIIRDVNRFYGLNLDAVVIYDYANVSKLSELILGEIDKNQLVLNPTGNEFPYVGNMKTDNKNTESNRTDSIDSEKREKPSLVKKTVPIELNSNTHVSESTVDLESVNPRINEEEVYVGITEIISLNLHIPQEELHYEISFKELGVDSINGIEIIRDVNKNFGLNLDAVAIYDYSTISMLAEYVIQEKIRTDETLKEITTSSQETDIIQPKKNLEIHPKKNMDSPPKKNIDNQDRSESGRIKLRSPEVIIKNDNNLKQTRVQLAAKENSVHQYAKSVEEVPNYLDLANLEQSLKEKIQEKHNDYNTTYNSDYNHNHNNDYNSYQGEEDIAIIGISGRFPGADNVEDFWNNLDQETDSIIKIPKERWDAEEYYDPNPKAPGKSYSKVGGFLIEVDKFDPLFFNIPPIEAIYMDPQQRLFLEEVWKALEDAGCCDRKLSEMKCGVFVGASQGDYIKKLIRNNCENSGEAFTGMATSILASRISYFLNLVGPSITIDTACSSSLVALHLACQSIKNKESEMAIVGGVRLMVTPDLHISTSKVEMLSVQGQCRAFDQSADGTIISEGVGAIILMPLKKALEEGHSIYAVIKGSGINQDGKTNGITAPSMQSQIRLESAVYKKSGINPREISYIETHGTGTKLGDPIEVKALTCVFEKYTVDRQFCVIGSVKSNIGHTTTAAGVTSLIKVLLAMKNKKIPATLHFEKPNMHLSLTETPFYVNNHTMDWTVPKDKPRLAAVSAFGFSGTNAHVVLQEFYDGNENREISVLPYYLITLSAKTQESYQQKIKDLLGWLEKHGEDSYIGDIAYTLLAGRSHFNIRGALVVKSTSDLKSKLKGILSSGFAIDYFMEYNNTRHVKADVKTKDRITNILEKLQSGVNSDYNEYKKNLTELAKYYAENKVTDCEGIFAGSDAKLIHLPTYPFFGDRYWVEENVESTNVSKESESHIVGIHPMIDRNISTFEEVAFEKSLIGREFYLRDHLVQNEKVLPAVAYLEMARLTSGISTPKKRVVKIINNYWLNAIKVGDIPKKIKVSLLPAKGEQNGLEYEVLSKEESGQEILHGKGQIQYASYNQVSREEYLDLIAIKNRCQQMITGDECYQLFVKGGLNLGRSFQSIKGLSYNENEVLATIQLPEHLKETFKEYFLHPTIMDGALEAVVGMVSAKAQKGGVRLPYYIGEVELFGALTETCFSYAKYTGRKKNGLQESDSYEVFILDEEGKVLVKVKDFSLWVMKAMGEDTRPLENQTNYFKYIWEKSDTNLPMDYSGNLDKDILIFDTDHKLTTDLRIKSEGKFKVILVKPGEGYLEDEDDYIVNPTQKEGYVKLLQRLKEKSRFPNNIVYLWSKESNYENESILMQDLQFSIYPLLYLYQGLESIVPLEKIKLNYMFQGDGKLFSPFSAAFGGFAKSLRLENTKFTSKAIQYDSSIALNDVSNRLILELLDVTDSDVEVLHSLEERFVRTIKGLKEEDLFIKDDNFIKDYNLKEDKNIKGKSSFTNQGVYLISGGFGKLGLIFARFLAKEYKAKLCLTSRKPMDANKKTQLEDLEALGGEVLFVQGDISVLKEATSIIGTVKESFGKINGVLHCAGMTKDSYLKNKSKEDMEQVIKPKVMGTINLDLLTKDEPLDLFILFSSTAAVTGNLGQADYAYGNCFMDYFAGLRKELSQKGSRFGKSLSINWPLWKDGGIQVDQSTKHLFENMGIKSLGTNEGVKVLEEGLVSDENQIVVLQGDTQKIHKLLEIKNKVDSQYIKSQKSQRTNNTDIFNKGDIFDKADIFNKGDSLDKADSLDKGDSFDNADILDKGDSFNKNNFNIMEKIHQDVKNAVKDILRIKEKDIFLEKDMNEYGFNSLTFTELANKINDIYSIQINPSIFFEYTTLGALSDYLKEEHYNSILAIHQNAEINQNQEISKKQEAFPAYHNKQEARSSSQSPSPEINESQEIFHKNPDRVNSWEDDYNNDKLRGEREPIAIIGIGGTLPQSDDMDMFWKNLEESKDLITKIPEDRWNIKDLPDNISKWGGFMKEIDKFDPLFFGISPMEAELMDPQQRIFLQTVWETIEDAGYKPSALSGTKTGLFVGVSTTDYRDVLKDSEIEALTSTGNSHCILTNRISYLLNLHGPSEPIDTACSSSLVAIHRGVESIYSGDCDMSIVGGVNVIASPTLHISFSKAGMLSPDGKCKTFDEKANGYVRGEGSGAILLKPLSKALKDGDNIYALIKGTAINHGGRAASMTAPNPNAQADVIIEAFDKAGFHPETVSYIEAHGTGTQLGDPIEVNGLIKAFKEMRKKNSSSYKKEAYCCLGSVKTNIGHLETAAGISSVIKVLLAMKHKKLPGLSNFNVQNPYIQLAGSPFYIAEKTKDWNVLSDEHGKEIPRRVGVSSFGFGGVNAHIALEEYKAKLIEKRMDGTQIFVLSARNKERLSIYAKKLLAFLENGFVNDTTDRIDNTNGNNLPLHDLAYTLQVGREEMEERLAVVYSSYEELVQKLSEYLEGNKKTSGIYQNNVRVSREKADLLHRGNTDSLTTDEHVTDKLVTDEHVTNELITKGDFNKIASLWVSGMKIDWKLLYTGKQLRRISLPTYPFEKRKVWKTNNTKKPKYLQTNVVLPDNYKDMEAPIENMFYLPTWKQVPLHKSEAFTISSNGNSRVLILVSANHYNLCQCLMEYHGNDEVYQIILGSENRKISTNEWEIDITDETALSDCLVGIDKLDYIYFLGGITSRDTEFNGLENLELTQEQGVVTLFRLVKALVKKELDNQNIHFKIITNNVHSLGEKDVMPSAGSILGFAKSMTKEFQYWNTSCLDIDMDEWVKDEQSLTKLIIKEPASINGEEIVIRDKKRYMQRLIKTNINKAINTPFRENGVYLIIGGAGGIGLEFSKYLAQEVKAKIALVGRSELTNEKKQKISEMEELGAEVLYLKADATDLESMQRVTAQVKKEFGNIHGVIHSAIVMKDKAIRNMSESNLLDALNPKVKGSVVLYEAVKEEKLDFIMFFSSIQSLVGNSGQANYAAACGFKDSFATHLKKSGDIPVKVINWGYWGTVGVASSEEHNRIMASKGMLSIQPEEGMEAIKRILSKPDIYQTIVLKAKPFLINQTDLIDKENGDYDFNNQTVPEKSLFLKYKSLDIEESGNNQASGDTFRHNYDMLSDIKARITKCISEVLKVEIYEIDSSRPFSDYGVDSITGVELINRINKEFGLILKTTILFDYSNVDDLAIHIQKNFGMQIEKQVTSKQIPSKHMVDADCLKDIDLHQIVIQKLVGCIIKTLKVNAEEIDFTMQFSEYGVDSITGVALLKNINETFGIALKNTVLFDYSNIQVLSEYLCREYLKELEESLLSVSMGSKEVTIPEMDKDIDALEHLANGTLDVEDVMKIITAL